MGIFRLTQSARKCIHLFIVFVQEMHGGGELITLNKAAVFSNLKVRISVNCIFVL